MATYIAFLRAMNVGGRFFKMADLRAGLSSKGFGDVESHIQSGNLRLNSSLRSAAKVELAVETALADICGFTVSTIVRTPAELGALTSYGKGREAPLEASEGGAVRRYVTFLKADPDDGFIARMNGWDIAGERAHVHGRELHLWLGHPSHESKLTDRLQLVPMSLELMEALLRGDRQSARAMVSYQIPAQWPHGIESVLRFRIAIARARPEALPLLFRTMVLRADPDVSVGRIGFHGPVDQNGMLEIGYAVFPAFRRQGYAREAARAMLRWAQLDPAVRRFRAAVSPENEPSLRLVTELGFVEVGSQWDEQDGEETVFERPSARYS